MAIRNASKGGDALYIAKDLFLAAEDAGSKPQTTAEDKAAIMAPARPRDADNQQVLLNTTKDWLAPIPPKEALRRRR